MMREVVLLRAVNVGGRTLSMAALRDTLAAAGCTDVATYIQSGNVVLTTPKGAPRNVQAWLEGLITELAGYEVPVVLRTLAEMQQTVARNPYPQASGPQLHVVFFAADPPTAIVDGLDLAPFAPEHCTLVGRDLYLHLPNGMGRATLPLALDKAGRKARPPSIGTARNWNTVVKLLDMAQ